MKYAAIDIGTNSVLLLVMRADGQLEELLDRSTVTRLGEGVLGRGTLARAAMQRTLEALLEYKQAIDGIGAERVICFGTNALREAGNRGDFVRMAKERAGLDIKVFSEYDEAYYTYLSVQHDRIFEGETLVIVDIGGGSTEITKGTRTAFADFVSLPIGTVKLTELFIRHDPPTDEELDSLVEFIRQKIPKAPLENQRPTIVGMAGTVTTLAAMILGLSVFDKRRIHGLKISLEMLDEWIERLSRMPVAERRKLTGMEPGREDLMLQGMLLMREITKSFEASEFVVSTRGARYGIIFEATGMFGT